MCGFGVWCSGTCGSVEPKILDLLASILLLRFSMWEAGSRMENLALETHVDFLAVVEHRLIPARVCSEWARLRCKGLASIWAPVCQDSTHDGNAGVGVISLRCALVALPTFATAQFKHFFDFGRAVRCMLPLGAGRFMHLVVLNGYQGADSASEQLAEQLFDAALGELGVVVRGQPCMLVGDFNVEPTKIRRAFAGDMQPAPTCKCTWDSPGGHRRDFMVGCLLAVAAVLSCKVRKDRWVALILLTGHILTVLGGLVGFLSRFSALPSGLLLGCLLLIRVGVPSRLRSRESGRCMVIVFSSCLGVMHSCWISASRWCFSCVTGLV